MVLKKRPRAAGRAAAPVRARVQRSAQSQQAPRSNLVILVDDHAGTQNAVGMLMKSVGLEMRAFSGPVEMLRSKSDDACCIVLDVRMPEMSGIELFRRLREQGIEQPVIFMTAYGDLAMAVRAMRDGAVDFLEKPVDDQVLIDSILRAAAIDAERRRTIQENTSRSELLNALTGRERQVAQLYAEGKSTQEIAEALQLSLRTVQTFRGRILRKLGISTLTRLVHFFST